MRTLQPRIVTDPRTLNIGDRIECSFPEDGGRTVTWTGTIGKRTHEGRHTFYTTTENTTLLVTGPDLKQPKIVLLKRAAFLDNVALF